MTVYLPGVLSVRAKLYSLAEYSEWDFLTPLMTFLSFTSWTSPAMAGHFQTTFVLLATFRASGAKKLSRTLTVLGFGLAALPACEIATGATVRAAGVGAAAAVLLLKLVPFVRRGRGRARGAGPPRPTAIRGSARAA